MFIPAGLWAHMGSWRLPVSAYLAELGVSAPDYFQVGEKEQMLRGAFCMGPRAVSALSTHTQSTY